MTDDKGQTVDPQLHCHATVFNATFDKAEDRWKAIQLGDTVRDKGYYQAAFHARLAAKLKDLGYGIRKDVNSFTLAGIDRATVEAFSRRSAVIDAEAERLGTEDAKAKGELGRRTREKKSKTPQSMAELRKEWNARLTPEERLAIQTAGSGNSSRWSKPARVMKRWRAFGRTAEGGRCMCSRPVTKWLAFAEEPGPEKRICCKPLM